MQNFIELIGLRLSGLATSLAVSNICVQTALVTRRFVWLQLQFFSVCFRALLYCFYCILSHRLTQPGHPSVGRRNEYRRKLGRRQAHRAMH